MLYKLLLDVRHIFDEGGIEEVLTEEAMDAEHEINVFSSFQPRPTFSVRKRTGSKEDTPSDESSNESADNFSDDDKDDSFNSIDKDDMVTSKSVTNTSLGLNLELVLEISEEDMLLDEASTPWDKS